MKSVMKKLLCAFLVICNVFALVTVPSFASETEIVSSDSGVLNAVDQAKLIDAIDALSPSITEGVALARDMYTLAFSNAFTMKKTPEEVLTQVFETGYTSADASADASAEGTSNHPANVMEMIVPTMYSSVPANETLSVYFNGAAAENPTKDSLIVGDLLIFETSDSVSMYIYNGADMVKLTKGDLERFEANETLKAAKAAKRYVVLRPSVAYSFPRSTEETDVLNDAQKAILATAKSYLMRGYKVQYDDITTFNVSNGQTAEFRWQKGINAPEDYTVNEISYTNCAAFCHDVLLNAIGLDVKPCTTGEFRWATNNHKYFKEFVNTKNKVDRNGDGKIDSTEYERIEMTAEEMAAEKELIYNTLQPGDIINVRYTHPKSGGHAMLYVGNGTIIHSGGSNYTSTYEVPEASIKYMRVDELFLENGRRYVFEKLDSFAIVRYLDAKSTPTEAAINRINNMNGIVAQKLSSVNEFNTVNRGDEITFTFSVYNTNEEAKTVSITDIVPDNTTYVSGAETVDGSNLSWNLTVPANETKTVSYTVKVNDNAEYGSFVTNENGKVGGITHKCGAISIKKTLTAAEQALVSSKAEELMGKYKGIELANEIYNQALNIEKIIPATKVESFINSAYIYDEAAASYTFNEDSLYTKMVPNKLFGGRKMNAVKYSDDRTRLVKPEHLIAGDMIVAQKGTTRYFYLKTVNGMIDLVKGSAINNEAAFLESLISFDTLFMVLRPSIVDSYVDSYVEPPEVIVEFEELAHPSSKPELTAPTYIINTSNNDHKSGYSQGSKNIYSYYSSKPEKTKYYMIEIDVDLKIDSPRFSVTQYDSKYTMQAIDSYKAGNKYNIKFLQDIEKKAAYLYVDNMLKAVLGFSSEINPTNGTVALWIYYDKEKHNVNGTEVATVECKQRYFNASSIESMEKHLNLYGGSATYNDVNKEYTLNINPTHIRFQKGSFIATSAAVNYTSELTNTSMMYAAGYSESGKLLFVKQIPYRSTSTEPVTVASPEKANTIKLFMFFDGKLIPFRSPIVIQNL